MKKIILAALAISLSYLSNAQISATPFVAGNLVVGRFTSAATTAQRITLLEINKTTNSLVRTLDIPFAGIDSTTLTNSSTDCQLQLSGNNNYITFVGYSLPEGSTTSILDGGVTRIIGRLDAATNYKAYKVANSGAGVGTGDPINLSNIRSAYTVDGNKFYFCGGSTSSTTATTGGVWFFTDGNELTPTQITKVPNTRWVREFWGQLYSGGQNISGTPGLLQGIYKVGTGVPENTITPPADTTRVVTPTSTSSISFYLTQDGSTMYVCDNSSTYHIEKWKLVSGTWTLLYNIKPSNVSTAPRGMAPRFTNTDAEFYVVYQTSVVKMTDVIANTTNPGTQVASVIYTETGSGLELRGISFAPGSANTLPVALGNVYATATAKKVSIAWETLSEVGVNNFDVQRSSDGISFTTIATVDAKRISTSLTTYSYDDNYAITGKVFYRIVINNNDGAKQISKVVAVKLNTNKAFNIANPVTDRLVIGFNENFTGNISVFDVAGKIVANKYVTNQNGMLLMTLPSTLKGMHIVTIQNANMSYSEKVFVQ